METGFIVSDENIVNFCNNAKANFPANCGRSAYWQFILYPESEYENWRDFLREQNIKYYCALHNKDINEKDLLKGLPEDECSLKKEHYHITFCFETLKGINQVAPYVLAIGGTMLLKVANVRHNFRYLIHRDDLDKYQYSESIIEQYGIDLKKYLYDNDIDLGVTRRQMCRFVKQNDIRYYIDLQDYCDVNNSEWAYALETSRNLRQIMFEYIKSYAYKQTKTYDTK